MLSVFGKTHPTFGLRRRFLTDMATQKGPSRSPRNMSARAAM